MADAYNERSKLNTLKNRVNSTANEFKLVMEELRNTPLAIHGVVSRFRKIAQKGNTSSQLPGRENGPADAYRHCLWTAMTARQYGDKAALNAVNMHEFQGKVLSGQSSASEIMDRHNNEVAAGIGQYAKDHGLSEEWVEEQCQKAVSSGTQTDANGGTDSKGLVWLPPDQWKKNPKYDQDDRVPKELWDKDIPIEHLNWPQNKIDWDNPYRNNPYTPVPPTRSEQPADADSSRNNSTSNRPAKISVREELQAQFRDFERKQNADRSDAPGPDEIDPSTGKKFKELSAGEYAAALYRRASRQHANQNATNDNRSHHSGGEVQVHAYDREGGKEHVRAHTRHKPV